LFLLLFPRHVLGCNIGTKAPFRHPFAEKQGGVMGVGHVCWLVPPLLPPDHFMWIEICNSRRFFIRGKSETPDSVGEGYVGCREVCGGTSGFEGVGGKCTGEERLVAPAIRAQARHVLTSCLLGGGLGSEGRAGLWSVSWARPAKSKSHPQSL